jgi:hypothetical protein
MGLVVVLPVCFFVDFLGLECEHNFVRKTYPHNNAFTLKAEKTPKAITGRRATQMLYPDKI